jgi:RND family efflux transporter MFP subunit
MVAAVGMQAGCEPDDARAGGGHAHGGHGGHGHGGQGGHGDHGEDDPAHSAVGYDGGFEVFVEHPHLVAGREGEWVIHVSIVDGYEPTETGSVAVVLTSESAPGERFETGEPSRSGLYRLSVAPEHAGTRRMFVVYRGPEGRARVSLGDVDVHESPPEHPPHGASSGGISLSKEQQWTIDLATGRARRRTLHPSVPAQGIVRSAPDATARLRAPFAGRVLEPNGGFPEMGDSVEAGQTLAVLAPTVEANALPMLRADLSKAKSERDRLEREVERLQGLVDDGAIPEKQLLNAESELEQARADVRSARERLAQYRSFDRGGRQAALELRAPVAGTVVERPVTGGEYVEAGEHLVRTLDSDRLRLEARVTEANLHRLERVGGVWFEQENDAIVEWTRSEERFFARIDRIDPKTRTSSIWFEIPDDHDALAPGQYHRVHLQTGESREALAIPRTALLERKGMWTVYVVEGPESFERRYVDIGMRDGSHVEIVDGLEPGERIVTRGAYYVELASATTGVGSHSH